MNISRKTLLFSALCALSISFGIHAKPSAQHTKILASLQKTSLTQWIGQCKSLETKVATPAQCTAQSLLDALQLYAAQKTEQFSSECLWVDKVISDRSKFEPFTQKLIVPAASTIYAWGDLHGDIQTFVRTLEKLQSDGVIGDNFAIKQPQAYFLFLGDYADRGKHGAEVLYTILRLKLKNPDKIYFVRGNHEDLELNIRLGFCGELLRKFPAEATNLIEAIDHLYNTLPVVLFMGAYDTNGICNYLQCCHGGMELGYHPQKLFAINNTINYERIMELPRLQHFKNLTPHLHISQAQLFLNNTIPDNYIKQVSKNDIVPHRIGFMWSDFSADANTAYSWYNVARGCGLSYGQNLTETLLRYYNAGSSHKIRGVIRAHQHNPTMPGLFHNANNKGLYKLPWQTPVFTTVATKEYTTGLGCFLKIRTAHMFNNWEMTRIHCNAAGLWETCTNTLEKY